jgi:hypothetical protein
VSGLDKYIDIDAALAERQDKATPLKVKLFKQMWDLPGTMPAAVTLRLFRWAEKGWIDEAGNVADEVGALDQMALLSDIVPSDVMDAWCAKGLDTSQLEPVISLIMDVYQLQAMARAEGEAPPPATPRGARGRASAKSASGGRTSKRTSNASTGSRTSGKR